VIRFVIFSVKRAWQGFWRNAAMSIAATATMTMMLLLLAGFWILQAGLSATLEFVEQKVEVVADVRGTASMDQVNGLADEIRAMPEVAAVVYVTPADALARFQNRLREQGRPDLTKYLDGNPLQGSLEVKLRDAAIFGSVVEVLRNRTEVVSGVKEIQKLVDEVLTITGILRTAGIVILGAIGLTVLFIVINTIRLAVVARSDEIEIMRLVGASDGFIRWPFVLEGAFVGLFGAAITLGLLALVQPALGDAMLDVFEVLPTDFGTLGRDVAILVLATGLGLGAFGSWLSVRSYLIR
jgi:cell division transport system permease protein